jgi:hypothetical protein
MYLFVTGMPYSCANSQIGSAQIDEPKNAFIKQSCHIITLFTVAYKGFEYREAQKSAARITFRETGQQGFPQGFPPLLLPPTLPFKVLESAGNLANSRSFQLFTRASLHPISVASSR